MALNYVSEGDLVDLLPESDQAQATDDTSGPNADLSRDVSMIERHLKMAESRVESYLVGYALPLDNPPQMIRWAVLVLASYQLMTRGDLAVSDEVERMHNEVITWLQEVQSGDAQIPTVEEDDEDFVGFGDTSTMTWDKFPYRKFNTFH